MRDNFFQNKNYGPRDYISSFLNYQIFYRNSIFILFTFIILGTNLISCQTTTTSITSASLDYDGIFGIGWGVFAIIIAIILGVICCIFGLSTVYPAIFITIGLCIPVIIFIIMAFSPLDQPGNLNLKDNTATNSFVVVKWLFFSAMLIGLLLLLIPYLSLWGSMLIPQRVDSRAQREYFQKYEKMLEEERRLKNEKEIKNDGNEVKDPNKNNNVGINNNNPGLFERETRLAINNPRESVRINNTHNIIQDENENAALTKNNLIDKKKIFLGGLMRRRRNEEN